MPGIGAQMHHLALHLGWGPVISSPVGPSARRATNSQEAFVIGQDIYERASELEAKTNELGLTNLDKKYIKKNLDEISIKVGQLDPEKNKAVGSYYSPGSNMNGTNTSQPTGINLSKEEVKSLADYANDIQSTKDAGLAIMKSTFRKLRSWHPVPSFHGK